MANVLDLLHSETNLIYEENRLKTFNDDWPHAFISPRILAKVGFHYVGPYDRVECYFCKVKICNWEMGDHPVFEHERWSINCPLLKKRKTFNIPIEPIQELTGLLSMVGQGIITELETPTRYFQKNIYTKPDFPEFIDKVVRLKTFESWPKNLKQSPELMSEAGFFYTQKKDRVICFFCGGGIKEWESSDDPWDQHAKLYKDCSYLKMSKGSQFIKEIENKKKKSKKGNIKLFGCVGIFSRCLD